MENKTIEQQIAEGVAKGIADAKNKELQLKKEKSVGTLIGLVTMFFTFCIMAWIEGYIGVEKLGYAKGWLKDYALFMSIGFQFAFTLMFLFKDIKKHQKEDGKKLVGDIVGTIIMSVLGGFLVSRAFV